MDAVLAALQAFLLRFDKLVMALASTTSPDAHEASRGGDGAWL